MADAYDHARSSAHRWGGVPEDYLPVHQFLDSSKIAWADQRHRAILHSSFGIGIALQVFGQVIRRKSDGRAISVRWITEQHIREDCGFVPTIEEWLKNLPMETWMSRGAREFVRTFNVKELENAAG